MVHVIDKEKEVVRTGPTTYKNWELFAVASLNYIGSFNVLPISYNVDDHQFLFTWSISRLFSFYTEFLLA